MKQRLELETERELHGSRTTYLEERIEAAGVASAAQSTGEAAWRLAKAKRVA